MNLKSTIGLVVTSLFVLACLLVAAPAVSQNVQVRSESVVAGSTAADDSVDGVIVPDLLDEIRNDELNLDVAYTYWVSPDVDRDFQTIDFLPKGGLLVRDGDIYREFLSNGDEKISDAFPIDCTKLKFESPKGQGVQDTYLSNCSASLVRNDNTMRTCGSVKGQGLKCIAYDLDDPGGDCAVTPLPTTIADAEARTCEAVRTTAEPPPQLTDAISDDSDFVELRWDDEEPRILIAGDRKSIFAIKPASRDVISGEIPLDAEDNVETIATFNGRKINAFTTLREYLIVAFENGELRSFNIGTGADEFFYQHTVVGDKKTPQGFALRSDPDETVVLALNKAAGTVTVLDSQGNIVDTDGDLTAEPFLFANPTLGNPVPSDPDFLGEGIVVRAGESGTFADCEIGETCQLGQQDEQVTQSDTTIVEQETFDPGYRIFQSFIEDCRWSGNRPCPIVNCPAAAEPTAAPDPANPPGVDWVPALDPANMACETDEISEGVPDLTTTGIPEEQVLNLTKATLDAESSGALAALLPDPPPVVTIPAYLRGDESYPRLGGGREFNDYEYEFYSLWAVSEVLIADVFDLVIDVDLHRFDEFGVINSDDPSDVDLPADANAATRLAEVADRSNAVIHNRDTYNSVPRGFPEDVAPDRKSGVLIDASIGSKGAKGFQWSAVTYGLQTYYDSAAGYLDLAKQQLFELQAHKDAFLCSQFEDPNMVLVGPTLSPGDCAFLQGKLDQVKLKSDVCHAALLQPQQGASRENCNALFTQIDNLLATLETQITPPALTELALIEPNYLGEFKSRVLAYRFTTEEWLLPVTPNGGIQIPAP